VSELSVAEAGVAEAGVAPPLRARLIEAGLLVPSRVDGLYGRSGAFEAVVTALGNLVSRTAADGSPTVLRFPPLLPTDDFLRTDYLRSFPDLTGAVSTFRGNDGDHRRLLRTLGEGGDWTADLTPSEVALCPAVCHPLYPTLAGRLPDGGALFDLSGWCFRHEPSLDPARMVAFRQHEIVCVGEPTAVLAHRDRWVDRGLDLTHRLGLATEAVIAHDPFFGRVGKVMAQSQDAAALKIELVVPVALETGTAVVSSNCHEDHFTAAFGVSASDGGTAHSACVGFGLERLTLALLVTHGLRPDGWPALVRALLWP